MLIDGRQVPPGTRIETNHWGGWCRPLDRIDFQTRPWVTHSGWPLDRPTLEPYYRAAHEVVGPSGSSRASETRTG